MQNDTTKTDTGKHTSSSETPAKESRLTLQQIREILLTRGVQRDRHVEKRGLDGLSDRRDINGEVAALRTDTEPDGVGP